MERVNAWGSFKVEVFFFFSLGSSFPPFADLLTSFSLLTSLRFLFFMVPSWSSFDRGCSFAFNEEWLVGNGRGRGVKLSLSTVFAFNSNGVM